MKQMMLSSSASSRKEGQHMFYMQDPLEVIRAQTTLARRDQILSMPRFWKLDVPKTIYATRESRAHLLDTFFSKRVFVCVWEHVTTSTDLLKVWQDHKSVGMASFVEIILMYTDKTTTFLRAMLPSGMQYILFSSTVRKRIVDMWFIVTIHVSIFLRSYSRARATFRDRWRRRMRICLSVKFYCTVGRRHASDFTGELKKRKNSNTNRNYTKNVVHYKCFCWVWGRSNCFRRDM